MEWVGFSDLGKWSFLDFRPKNILLGINTFPTFLEKTKRFSRRNEIIHHARNPSSLQWIRESVCWVVRFKSLEKEMEFLRELRGDELLKKTERKNNEVVILLEKGGLNWMKRFNPA